MKYLLALFVIMSATAFVGADEAELRHYEAMVIPYDNDVYEMKMTELTHNSYKSYTLEGSLKAFKQRNTEREGTIRFNIGFFNVIKYDTVDDWMKETKDIVVINQKQGNDMTVVGEGKLGDHSRYLIVANSISDDGRFGIIDFKVGYITLGRMLTMQIFFQGDTTNDAALRGFLRMANDLLHQVVDGEAKPFTGSLELAADWRKQRGKGK